MLFRYGGGPASADEQLMKGLGDTIQSMKEDFMVVHLYEPCSFCRCYISGENRYAHPSYLFVSSRLKGQKWVSLEDFTQETYFLS